VDAEKAVSIEVARDRIARLFKFVRALYEKRNPAPRQLGDQPWLLQFARIPDHDSIDLLREVHESQPAAQLEEESIDATERLILTVRRPTVTLPPDPPEAVVDWLTDSHKDCRKTVEIISSRNIVREDDTTEVVFFENDPTRSEALEQYQRIWNLWAERERINLAAGEVFGNLYTLHGNLQRESEQFQLVLGDGILVWRRPDGGVRFPLLIRELRLEFDAEIPEFRLVDPGFPTEFYSSLFRSMPDVEGKSIGQIREEAEKLALHPLGRDDVNGFLRRVAATLSSQGEFIEGGEPGPERSHPVIGRAPAIFLRKRTLGFTRAIDAIIEDALQASDFSESLQNIVGISPDEANPSPGEASEIPAIIDANEDSDILFTKEANAEQLQIARNLESFDCVLVQGPPGTGKTHTIANLLGHLLAHGKSVLVTSHRTKALRVLREKVVEELQPLCLSVLDEDAEDGQRLKSSVDGIVERLGMSNAAQLAREVAEFEQERRNLLDTIARLRIDVREARLNEQRYIVIGGEGVRPIEAAKLVAEGSRAHSWVPEPVILSEPMPLGSDEIAVLYGTNATVSADDQQSLSLWMPEPGGLLHPDDFEELVRERQSIEGADRAFGSEFWDPNEIQADSLWALHEGVQEAILATGRLPAWSRAVVNAGIAGAAETMPWDALVAEIRNLYTDSVAAQEALLTHDPQLPPDQDAESLALIFRDIAAEMRRKGRLSFFALIIKKQWKLALNSSRVGSSKRPQLLEHFMALQALAEITARRKALRGRWERQVGAIGGPAPETFRDSLESECLRLVPAMVEALAWFRSVWGSLQQRLIESGFDWTTVKSRVDTQFYDDDNLGRIERAAAEFVLPALSARVTRLHWANIDSKLLGARDKCRSTAKCAPIVRALSSAIESLSASQYRNAFEELTRLHAVAAQAKRRNDLLERLSRVAPAWAQHIRARDGIHASPEVPGDPVAAWRWRQLHDELVKRDQTSLSDLLQDLEHARIRLRDVTAHLVDRMAWYSQQGRTGLAERQALNGWYLANKKIGRGTGKRVPALRRLARSLMTEAQSAVPVWIMPLVKVAESYDPRKSKFDVVIIDEASQSDVTGLFAFYLAKQVIIVGDDEQVSPDAVGERVEETQHLIDEYLQGIPLADLYDGRQSIYDIAKQAFGGTICLLEHFRCVPDIIRFSNALSYNGRIKPLREASASALKPAAVPYRVDGALVQQKVNEKEARAVAALVCAAAEQPEYADKTFGVISLVGEEQARRIEELIRSRLDPAEIERRRLLTGNAAQFQGDERDVVFLSVVDVSEGAPLPLRQQPLFKKRFNVAASRARDQMWVIHSLDPGTDLKPGDLRKMLIEHAINPASTSSLERTEGKKTESPFELDVLRRLIAAGFRVKSQVPVGAYRIDMVVEGFLSRLAVECDGERFHKLEDLDRDLARQAILERLGWRFIRIRGSQFYRDSEKALKPLFEKLTEMDILPLGQDPAGELAPAVNAITESVRARAAELIADEDFGLPAASSSRWSRRARYRRADEPGAPAGASGREGQATDSVQAKDFNDQERPPKANGALGPDVDNAALTVAEAEKDQERASPDAAPGNTDYQLRLEALRESTKTPDGNNRARSATAASQNDAPAMGTLVERLRARSFRLVDNRRSGGSLWVLGNRDLAPFFEELKAEGIKFIFTERGGRSTGHRPAWFTKSDC